MDTVSQLQTLPNPVQGSPKVAAAKKNFREKQGPDEHFFLSSMGEKVHTDERKQERQREGMKKSKVTHRLTPCSKYSF